LTVTADDPIPTATAPALVDRAAALSAGEAIVMPEERVSFPELAARTATMARRLRAAGVDRGDRVGLLHGDCIDALALLLGAMRIGAVPVPVNARYKAREIEHVVENAGIRTFLVDSEQADALDDVSLPGTCEVVIGLDGAFAAGGEALDPADVERLTRAVRPDDPALILYTSGTTANPKGCVYAHGGLTAQAFAYAEALDLTPADRFWTPLPFFHVSAIVSLAATLAAPCTLFHVGRRFEPTVALDQLESERCTVAFPAFETIWLGVLNHPRFPDADLSSLRLIVNVGTPGSLRRMQERVPAVPQVSAFGGTESGGFATLGRADDPLEARLATGGRPLRDVELRAVDPETGQDVPAGQVGELLMRGPTRFVRYHEDPELTSRVIDGDGWFHSGDLGRIDADGRVAFVGRLKDMLKVGGENVAAAEVESFLLTHDAVEIVQVVSAPDARYVEVPAAFVQLKAGAEVTERELIDFCRGKIASFKVPRYVRFVGEWPMSGTKIQKFRLRETIAAELEQAGIAEAPKISSRR
jgi:fatty-acyl-CoA synthase